MSQVGNALKMMVILQSRGKLKIKDLAEILEVDERTIRRYKDDLEQGGIYVTSKGGKDGGYFLDNDYYLTDLIISDEEYISLQIAQKQLSDTNHPVSKDFNLLLEKINLVYRKNNERLAQSYMVKATKSYADMQQERKKLIDIHAAIITRNKIRMEYISLTSGLKERTVCPYTIYQYNGDMYFTGFCELRQDFIDFKMSRVKDYAVLNERFEVEKDFKLEDFMKNCIGIYKGKEYGVKLKIQFPMSQIVKEKVWVDEQKITDYEDGSILYEARMRGLPEIKSWVLGMGSCVSVLKPEELKVEIRNEIEWMKKIYS